MDGVLETTISLLACKVLCGLVCLPSFRGSVSSVTLCCSCLLLFTDLSITVFLTSLWCGAPTLMSFQPSSDVIALRFGLFLGNTYGAVLLLTPPLVAVEVLTRLLWPREETASAEKVDGHSGPAAPLVDVDGEPWEKGVAEVDSGWGLRAVGFLGCLLLWGMCGTCVGSNWRQEQPAVRACLEGGGSLSACLPCLLSTSSPVARELAWALPSAALLLGLAQGLGLLGARLARTRTERPGRSEESGWLRLGRAETAVLTRPPRPGRAGDSLRAADMERTVDSSSTTCSSHPAHNNPLRPAGNAVLTPGQTATGDGCKLNSESVSLPPHVQCQLPVEGADTVGGAEQATPPREKQVWPPERDSPCPGVGVMTGLACVFLVCICPTVLSTNIALISSLDTLAVYIIQQLLTPPRNREQLYHPV
ncbi:uncharacterized protein LOC143514527 [Brachyhypopomus gauderio]|uniref:uncharacterized protein LOC143514527 n=1 Tax=Brachyhypopomus gauderio TaxID=698409 RepID=UPI00404192B6